jgi:hypothetical protein
VTEEKGMYQMKDSFAGKIATEHHTELIRKEDKRRMTRKLRRALGSQTDSITHAKAGAKVERTIQTRWGISRDEPRIGELLDLNGLPRQSAIAEQFVVAVEDGEVLALTGYRTAPKRLVLGPVIADPWAGERDLAVALYAGVRGLARDMGVRKILARSDGRTNYPRLAGYRRRLGGWTRGGQFDPVGGQA